MVFIPVILFIIAFLSCLAFGTWLVGVPMETRLQDPVSVVVVAIPIVLALVVAVGAQVASWQITADVTRNWNTNKRNED